MNIDCHSCSKRISEGATKCPYCRAEIEQPPAAGTKAERITQAPGWYTRPGDVDTVTYWDGLEWTNKVAPTRVTHDVKSLALGVAWGVILASLALVPIGVLIAYIAN